MADANTMIRCIIGDDEQKIYEFQELRATQKIVYSLEVIAEVVYVLTKVYNVSRKETGEAIQRFLASRNIVCSANEIALKSLQLYAENHLDFVDNVLFAYNQLHGITIYSYDRKLMNAISRSNANQSE